MNDDTKALLRKIVADWTENGSDMAGLLYLKEEVVYRLREWKRDDEAARLEDAADFRLTWTEDGLVWLLTGAGLSNKERLIDFKADG